MIAVVADDISGAAELAGAALRHGLSAELQTAFDPRTDAEVICVDVDSRSLAPLAAAAVITEVVRRVAAARPAWVYKKCDSVLRGSVLAETRAMLGALGKTRALLVPANPSRGRTIRGGEYFVGGQPLHETIFSRDPEHPRRTSRVADLLGADLDSIVVPDTQSAGDVDLHAAAIDDATLPVGGVDLFEALLRQRCQSRGARAEIRAAPMDRGPVLLVCGSAAAWAERRDEARTRGIPVFEMPHDLAAVNAVLQGGGKGLMGIGDESKALGQTPADLVRTLAEAAAGVLRGAPVERLLLEGGATAAAVVRALGWSRLRACEVSLLGVGVLKPLGAARPRVFIKPGSYAWPPQIWPGV